MGKETKSGSQMVSKWGLASHTKLKFRQPGQTNTSDVARRDLRAELAAAERVAENKKRKAAGLQPLPPVAGALQIENGSAAASEAAADDDEERAKRRKVLEEAAELDKDDSSDDDDDEDEDEADKGKGKAGGDDDDDDEDDDDDSDE